MRPCNLSQKGGNNGMKKIFMNIKKYRNRDEVFYPLANIFMWVQKNTKNTCIKKGVTVKQYTQSFHNVCISD